MPRETSQLSRAPGLVLLSSDSAQASNRAAFHHSNTSSKFTTKQCGSEACQKLDCRIPWIWAGRGAAALLRLAKSSRGTLQAREIPGLWESRIECLLENAPSF